MDGRDFLAVARELAQGDTEAHWRTATGRAYYALMLEARGLLARWGVSVPHGNSVHAVVRLRFINARLPELKDIGHALEKLVRLRNDADYQLGWFRRFQSGAGAQSALEEAELALAQLDAIEQDGPLRLAAIAAIRAAGP